MNWKDLIKIYISDKSTLTIEIGVIIVFVVFLMLLVYLFSKLFFKKSTHWLRGQDIELNIALGGIGSVKIKPNHESKQIAHKAWTELITRKAGLMFEPENDVIVEVYNSWYCLFGEMRNLIKNIPASQIKNEDTQLLVSVLVDSLNKGLRPHLTKWQAKFRKWYDNELEKEENNDKTPQEIQKTYPFYNDLIYDLIAINAQMVSYANEIKKIVN